MTQSAPKRSVGRPKLLIDPTEVATVAARLYDENGFDAVSIESVAEGLGVSRATLYRTVRSLDELHSILLDRLVHDVEDHARELLAKQTEPGAALVAMIRFQVDNSVRMRNYSGVYFGWGLSDESYKRWRRWANDYESLWTAVVEDAVEAGYLQSDDVQVTTRLILGMLNWVSRWYSGSSARTAESIGDAAVRLVLPGWKDQTD
ncbi:MAG: TetR/AcrR family transcriptional regulator [Nocardioides sp.]|uniref:TetR/AcrR family transcriptional regulator n=1 Tax=Nocardioides sp. TaxID=35761 RepID=UPI0039E4536B